MDGAVKPISYGRIVNGAVINSFDLVYAVPALAFAAVLDGDVVLGPSVYELRGDGTIKLKHRPEYGLRFLVGAQPAFDGSQMAEELRQMRSELDQLLTLFRRVNARTGWQ